jgi:glycosyltransferase involved in cell wall biosynthesis
MGDGTQYNFKKGGEEKMQNKGELQAFVKKGNSSPWFSIVISVYNRANMIMRCVESCLKQSFDDFEVVVVDDGSTDGTKEILKTVTDSRFKLICHKSNQGLCAARDTGVRNAIGKWIITLDSDHALIPGALENLYARTYDAPEDVGVIGSRYIWDTGKITPSFVPEGIIDYVGRIKWVDQEGGTDFLCCYRRELYDVCVSWPAHRRKGDAIFQLDLAKCTKQRIDPDIIAIEYSDADNTESRTKAFKDVKVLLRYAADWAWQAEEILRKHGQAIARHAPNLFAVIIRTAGLWHFVAGQRKAGVYYMLRYLSMNPVSLKGWTILGLGLLHRVLLAGARCLRYRITRARFFSSAKFKRTLQNGDK